MMMTFCFDFFLVLDYPKDDKIWYCVDDVDANGYDVMNGHV